MGNYDKNNYNVALWWNGLGAFTTVVNNVNNAKYNGARWRQFGTWGRTMTTPEWKVNVEDTNINIAAAVLSVNGKKPSRGVGGWGTYSGTIPLIGHQFSLTADDFLKMRSFQEIPGDKTYHQRFTYIKRLANNIGGMHNRINMFVYQALSSGFITADKLNNGEGLQDILIDLKFKREHYLAPAKPWAQTDADPIQDLIDAQDLASDETIPVTNWLMSKKMIRTLAEHPSVRTKIAIKMYPVSTQASLIPLTRKEVISGLTEYYDILPIIEIDEKAEVQQDGEGVELRSFDESVAALCTPTNFFELQHCNNVYGDDINPNVTKTTFEDGRITMIVKYSSDPLKITSSMECFVLPVPRNPNNIFLLKADATAAQWGDADTVYNERMKAIVGASKAAPKVAKAKAKAASAQVADEIEIDGVKYARATVIAELKTLGNTINPITGVAKVQAQVDDLDAETKAKLVEALAAAGE